jgi:hypothetical protein
MDFSKNILSRLTCHIIISILLLFSRRLSRIPQNLPPSLQSLHLEDNRLCNLSSGDFKNLRNLGELNLHGNRITSLPPSVFADLISLRSLDLRSNAIDVIYRESFANLSKLQTLDMSQNPIKVIVTGAFIPVAKLSLLHLSRLLEPVEFDSTSLLNPLTKLQILELDDSPHFALKIIQDSALTHVPNLVELNLQRCELEDVNLVCNSLAELNLQVVKLSGNPWDCHDLQDSALHELTKRRTIADDPVCDQPSIFKGVQLDSLNTSLLQFSSASPTQSILVDLQGNSEEETSLVDFTEMTRGVEEEESGGEEEVELNYTTTDSKGTNTPNTNSPENVPHGTTGDGGPGDHHHHSGSPDSSNGPISSFTSATLGVKNNSSTRGTVSKLSLPSSNMDKSRSNATGSSGNPSIVKSPMSERNDDHHDSFPTAQASAPTSQSQSDFKGNPLYYYLYSFESQFRQYP